MVQHLRRRRLFGWKGTMAAYLWLVLAIVSDVAASLLRPPRQLSPCQVVQNDVFCNDLNLRTVPAKLPHGIQKLDLSRNFLQNLTQEVLAIYTTVHHLNLHSNKIQFIQPGLFKDMTNLQVLDLSSNYLDVFAVSKTSIGPLTAVERLDLSGNGLYTGMTDFFLSEAPALMNLSLNGNSITKVGKETFCGSLALRNIDLHNNVILEIEDGAFDSLLHLSELDLSINSITCITDFNLSKLKVLNLSKNSMECFQTTDSDLEYELLYLDLRENNIHYFPVLPRRNKLMYLDLSRNRLLSVNTTGTADELEHFRDTFVPHTQSGGMSRHQDFSRLKYLNMSYNQIKSIPTSFFCSMVSLVHLNVSNNCIGAFSIDQESPLNSLKTLDLSYNALQNLSFGENTLRSLQELFLQGNFLNIMDSGTFQRLPSIRGLHLQQNYLKVCPLQRKSPQTDHNSQDPPACVSFTSIPSLHLLYISGNNLEVLPPYAFNGTPLRLLDLSLNPGLDIHQNAFSSLETSLTNLSLRENHIPELNTDLSLLSSLKFVDLSTNKLTTLPLWNKVSSIESLNLQNNNLVTLEYNTVLVLERTLKTLYMGSNPLSCCSNPRFLNMLQHSDVVIPDIATVTCQYTENSEPVEVNVGSVKQEQCQKLDSKSVSIIVIVVTALVLIAVLVVLSKVCHPKRRKLNISFRA
ncbi:transforming growth factor beta activator LRRC32 isoform X2 [Salmo salar]|uniref:Transforming growth factor beta activator LRRC32 isoform X2 n=1 Tax=Salmo salar TaxID=8030 RepID=A0A1S3RNB1_SALSA|nr:transforming growth factor beta activator LRRC32-like isoform X2 [Salmo salar]|eukprot:XP_014053312.1 PREDICTED: leucine-rich repeat-containing protein 32-like isoform X2 [Salmo salar]